MQISLTVQFNVKIFFSFEIMIKIWKQHFRTSFTEIVKNIQRNVDFLLYDYLKYFTGSIGYFILGYYLYIKQKSVLKNKNFGLVLFVAGTLLSFLGTVLSSMAIGGQSLLFFNLGDVTPNACLQAIGMFIIVLNTDCEK